MYPSGPGNGAPVQQPLCAQGPGHSKLPGQRSETGEGVGPGAQQGCVQQVGGTGGVGEGQRADMLVGVVGKGLVQSWRPLEGQNLPTLSQGCSRRPSQWTTAPSSYTFSLVIKKL